MSKNDAPPSTLKNPQKDTMTPRPKSNYYTGMALASVFSLVYVLTPAYMISATIFLICSFPSRTMAWIIASPLLFSAFFTKPVMNVAFIDLFRPVLDYFDYEEINEVGLDEYRRLTLDEGKNFIWAVTPHGVFSYGGLCTLINTPHDLRGYRTAVASSLLKTPILKNFVGTFGLLDASGPSLKKYLAKKGPEGTVVIYVGGIAEMFRGTDEVEHLYIKKRKGFIKHALRAGVDVIPFYVFGNSSVLDIVKTKALESLSRKMGVSMTFLWGKYYLPIPRDDKIITVRGKPLGIPHVPEPTDDEVNKWHAKYCYEVKRLFETYKHKVPKYKNKKLVIE